MQLKDLERIDDWTWEVPKDHRRDMLVPVRVYGERRLIEDIIDDRSLEQAVNCATLPGVVGHVYVMPDVHQGYGFPIGGVVATALPDGVVSPGGIGYDINCGVRLLASDIDYEEAKGDLDALATALDHLCPSGVGVGGRHPLRAAQLEEIAVQGAKWAKREGFATADDLRFTESDGTIDGADPSQVSERARDRGKTQLGTLGAGNHFIEVGLVEQVYHPEAADRMGIREGILTVLIHTGSRGYGHQICTDYVHQFQKAMRKYDIHLPDRELACAPMSSEEGQAYMGAMRCAANFAFTNRQLLAAGAREAFAEIFGGTARNAELRQVYDIAHNIGKVETHVVEGERLKVFVHRKGATRAFGPGLEELPVEYRDIGQPVFVPGSMGTASWILIGTEGSMAQSFGSTCHGAGRNWSRSKARKQIRGEQLIRELESRGIHVRAGSMRGLAEEAPEAYKDVDRVVESVSHAGIAKKVARLRPVAVIKG